MADMWGLRCLDCNDNSYEWYATHYERCHQLVRIWPLIRFIARAVPVLLRHDEINRLQKNHRDLGLVLEINQLYAEGPSPFIWLADHDEHTLCLRDEYGYWFALDEAQPNQKINSIGNDKAYAARVKEEQVHA